LGPRTQAGHSNPVPAIMPLMIECLLLLMALLRATLRDRTDLIAENVLLRHQLTVLTRPTRMRPRLRRRDQLIWVLARLVRRDWRRHLVVVTPDTVVRWHRRGWRLFWRSGARTGRPRVCAEVRELIATMAHDNPRWGAERIRGELLKLGIAVSKASVQRYRRRGPARPPSQTWRTFLRNHRPSIWAADLLTVQTVALRTLYVLVFVGHARRELVHLNVTASPTAAWIWRQLIAATPWGRTPRYLIRDRDAVYGGDFVPRARRLGTETVLTPVRAPRANAVAERLVGTLRRECLDHFVIVNEAHLRAVLTEFVRFYNRERPHRTLRLETPVPIERSTTGAIRARSVLGGLHHAYERAA
jgi:transposase InsO family protein